VEYKLVGDCLRAMRGQSELHLSAIERAVVELRVSRWKIATKRQSISNALETYCRSSGNWNGRENLFEATQGIESRQGYWGLTEDGRRADPIDYLKSNWERQIRSILESAGIESGTEKEGRIPLSDLRKRVSATGWEKVADRASKIMALRESEDDDEPFIRIPQ
jgi:hypothetical protein